MLPDALGVRRCLLHDGSAAYAGLIAADHRKDFHAADVLTLQPPLRRPDIRLGLIGLDQNRALSTESLRRILQDGLANRLDRTIPRRSLDGSSYEPGWLFLPQPNGACEAYPAINR